MKLLRLRCGQDSTLPTDMEDFHPHPQTESAADGPFVHQSINRNERQEGSAMNLRTLPAEWGITVVRVMAGIIITLAGVDKLNGGFDAFTKYTTSLALPAPELWGVVIPLLETIGGLLILFGLGARWVALLFVIEYAVTSFVVKA